jgi:hypothetical protein
MQPPRMPGKTLDPVVIRPFREFREILQARALTRRGLFFSGLGRVARLSWKKGKITGKMSLTGLPDSTSFPARTY